MIDQTTQLRIKIDPGPDASDEELENLTRQLREELIELDIGSVDLGLADGTPAGSKSGLPIDWTTLFVTLAASGGVITTMITAIQAWLIRHYGRSVTLEIGGDKLHVTDLSSEEQQRLINAWLSRHRGFVLPNE